MRGSLVMMMAIDVAGDHLQRELWRGREQQNKKGILLPHSLSKRSRREREQEDKVNPSSSFCLNPYCKFECVYYTKRGLEKEEDVKKKWWKQVGSSKPMWGRAKFWSNKLFFGFIFSSFLMFVSSSWYPHCFPFLPPHCHSPLWDEASHEKKKEEEEVDDLLSLIVMAGFFCFSWRIPSSEGHE